MLLSSTGTCLDREKQQHNFIARTTGYKALPGSRKDETRPQHSKRLRTEIRPKPRISRNVCPILTKDMRASGSAHMVSPTLLLLIS